MSQKRRVVLELLHNCIKDDTLREYDVKWKDVVCPILDLESDVDPIYEYFTACIHWYRRVKVYGMPHREVTLILKESGEVAKRAGTLKVTILLSTYARWCLECKYYVSSSSFLGSYLPFGCNYCFGCIVNGRENIAHVCRYYQCPLYRCCKMLHNNGYLYRYIIGFMLEVLRDTILEAVEELGFDDVWTWLPYFEDSVLSGRGKA